MVSAFSDGAFLHLTGHLCGCAAAAAGEHYGPWYFRPPLWPLEMPVITNALWLAHQKALNPLVHDAAACRRLVDDTNRLLMLGGPKGLGITPHNGAKH